MHHASLLVLALALGAPAAPPAVVAVGLQLRDGAPGDVAPAPVPPPAKGKGAKPRAARPLAGDAVPSVAGSPTRNPLEVAVDDAVRGRLAPATGARAASPGGGAPPSPPARHALDEIARNAGLDAGQITSAANTPRDQAQFLVEQLFDPNRGESLVRSVYGMPGAVAAESYRRLRDVYQILDLSPEQKQAVVDVAARALVALNVTGQVESPDYELVDVDPGPRADRAGFEQAIAASAAVARCIRPAGRAGEGAYLLEIPRRGAWLGGGACNDPWASTRTAGAPAAPTSGPTSGLSDSGAAGVAVPSPGTETATLPGQPGSAVEVAPLSGGAANPSAAAGAAPGTARPSGPASSWTYIVTDGPQGPVVTLAPAR